MSDSRLHTAKYESSPDSSSPALDAFRFGGAGLAARAALLGIAGKLHADSGTVAKTLEAGGPISRQVAATICDMEAKGWEIKPLGLLNDGLGYTKNGVYIDPREVPAAVKIAKSMEMSKGFAGLCQPWSRNIYFNAHKPLVLRALGDRSDWEKYFAKIIAHETAHDDRVLSKNPFTPRASELTPAEQLTLDKRYLTSEIRAHYLESLVGQELGVPERSLKLSIKNGYLGSYLHRYYREHIPNIGEQEAEQFTNELLAEHPPFAKDAEGRTKFNFDFAAKETSGYVHGDEYALAKLDEAGTLARCRALQASSGLRGLLAKPSVARGLTRLGQFASMGAGSYMLSDTASAFQKSTAHGAARLTRLGLTTAGCELGSVLLDVMPWKYAAIAGAVAGPIALDFCFGKKWESQALSFWKTALGEKRTTKC